MTASKKESNMWERLSKAMRGYWVASRIESGTTTGIPDVFFAIPNIGGWIELKVLDEFPKKATTPVKIPHLYDQQKKWIKRYGKIAGNVWFFIYVESTEEYFLWPWNLIDEIESLNRHEWRMKSTLALGDLDPESLYRALLAGCGGDWS